MITGWIDLDCQRNVITQWGKEDSGCSPDTPVFPCPTVKVNGKLQQAEICRTSDDSDPLRKRYGKTNTIL